jgi:hypothetical protein
MGDIFVQLVPSSSQKVAAMLGGTTVYLKNFIRDSLYQEAALAARAFIKFSPPLPKGGFGDTDKARKQGEIALTRDVRSFVRSSPGSFQQLGAIRHLGEAMGYEAFLDWKMVPDLQNKNPIIRKIHADTNNARAWQKFKNITNKVPRTTGESGKPIKSGGELAEIHKSLKTKYRGRITRMGGPGAQLKRQPYILKENKIASYIKNIKVNVGTLNHYWYQVIRSIPTIRIRGIDARSGEKGLPNFIKRSPYVGRAPGQFIDNARFPTQGVSSVTIKNNIGDIFGVAREAQTKKNVFRYRLLAMAKRPWQNVLDRAIIVTNNGGRPL